jgi:antitoxin YefM
MNVVSYSDARNNLKSIIDRSINDCEAVIIHRRDSEDAVLMGKQEFDAWQETVYLLSSPKNAQRLIESIEQYKMGNIIKREI